MSTGPALWTQDNLPMKLARVDVVAPIPPATPDQAVAFLKESIEDVGFEVTVRMAHSNCTVDGFG